jgi:hypothetical protein
MFIVNNASARRSIYWIAVVVLVFAPPTHARSDLDLSELSLEDLLEIQLEQMAITGIHHTHDAGEWMVGYSFMAMGMDGNLEGTSSRSKSEIFDQGFAVTPVRMYMEMQMFNLMYGVTDDIMLMGMLPYIRKSMDHVRMDGKEFTTDSRGIGDIEMSALYSVYRTDNHRLIAIAGVSFPSGSIDETDLLPGMMMGPSSFARLPYPMQLGSGTYDFKLGATYLGQMKGWTWGAHSSGKIHSGKNKHDYRLGDSYESTAWAARKTSDWSSASLRLKWSQWLNIKGADPMLTPTMVSTADPDSRAGRRLDLLFGANGFTGEGRFEGLRIGLEAGLPVFQSLDGPQLKTDWIAGLSIDWTL